MFEKVNNLIIKGYVKSKNLLKREEGQGMVEYGLIIALVAIGAIGAITILRRSMSNTFNEVSETLGNSTAP
ncbi:MAG: Flp family type IVb pilin [bacterium]